MPLAGGIPILALDMYEHAYHMDFGAAAARYVDAFMANIDWAQVYERYQAAVHGASEPFAAGQDDVAGAAGARRPARRNVREGRDAHRRARAGATRPRSRRGPATCPEDKEIVVYCVYGHEVGRATALRLRAQGVKARFLRGGIDAWQAAGRPVDPKGDRVVKAAQEA